MAQNFDPEWAKHLKHDPDKPLAVDTPYPKMKFSEVWEGYKQLFAEPPKAVGHDENRRPKVDGGVSHTWMTVTLKIAGTDETMEVACETSTEIFELSEWLGAKVGVDYMQLAYVTKQGCSYKKLFANDQVARHMKVLGIKSFTKQKVDYGFPRVIVGAGHLGLRMSLQLLEYGQTDFVCVDRMFRVGGTSWMYQANSTSKLQTEYGGYHLAYGAKYELPEYFTTAWPSRNALLNMFQSDIEKYGAMPYMKLNTNVKHMEIQTRGKDFAGPASLKNISYDLTFESMKAGRLKYGKLVAATTDNEGEEELFRAGAVCCFPGNLTIPRMEVYKGEDEFEGDIGYGMFNEIDYHALEGLNVTICGHGAFAVENIRTCCEFGVAQVYLVCRRLNISCPRVVSWAANRSLTPLKNSRFLTMMQPMYDLINRDPFTYYAVSTNEKRTTCTITQKARFGIGDIYFLSIYMGKTQVHIDPDGVKRCAYHEVHLHDGTKLPCQGILKLLGLVGELDIDRLFKIKELVGFWVNGDPRRYVLAEPLSVMSSNMGGTTFSPGAYSWSIEGIYFQNHPQEFDALVLPSGLLPRHAADLSDECSPRPAYVVDARHGTGTGMAVTMTCPAVGQKEQDAGFIKAIRTRMCHPVAKFLEMCKQDWDYYAEKFLKEGFGNDKPYPDYPYTIPVFLKMYGEHMMEVGEGPLGIVDEHDTNIALQVQAQKEALKN